MAKGPVCGSWVSPVRDVTRQIGKHFNYPEEGPREPDQGEGHKPVSPGQEPGHVELKGTGHPLDGAAVKLW